MEPSPPPHRNRVGRYGYLYAAVSEECALAEFREMVLLTGSSLGAVGKRDVVSIDVAVEPVLNLSDPTKRSGVGIRLAAIVGDDEADRETCRRIADWARLRSFVAILAPSAASAGEQILVIYPDMHPASSIDLDVGPDRLPINYGDGALLTE